MNLKKIRSIFRFFIPLLITCGLLVFLISKINFNNLVEIFASSNILLFIIITTIFLVLNSIFFSFRWQQTLNIIGYSISFKKALILSMASYPISKITPLNSGDLARAYFLKNQISISKNSGAIVMERLFDFLILALFAIIGGITVQNIYSIITGVTVGIAIFGLLLLGQKIKLRKKGQIYDRIRNFLQVFKNVQYKPKNIIYILFFTILIWFDIMIYIKLVFFILGYNIPLFLIMALQPLVILLAIVPITLSGIGSREMVMIFLYQGLAPDPIILSVGLTFSMVAVIILSIIGLPFLYIAIKTQKKNMPELKQISILVPIYNEEKSIARVVQEIKEVLNKLTHIEYEIILINDGSTDNSLQIIKQIEGINVLEHSRNKGYGASLKTGIKHSQYDWIMIIDADGTYPVAAIPELLKYTDNHDQIIGSREKKNNAIPFERRHAKKFLNRFASYIAGRKVPDLNSGLRIFKKDIVRAYWGLFPTRFSFTSTLTMVCLSHGYDTKFIPIDYYERTGKSSIRALDFFNFLKLIFKLSLFFKPIKIFAPLSGLILMVPLTLAIAYLFGFSTKFFDTTIIVLSATALQTLFFGLLAEIVIHNK